MLETGVVSILTFHLRTGIDLFSETLWSFQYIKGWSNISTDNCNMPFSETLKMSYKLYVCKNFSVHKFYNQKFSRHDVEITVSDNIRTYNVHINNTARYTNAIILVLNQLWKAWLHLWHETAQDHNATLQAQRHNLLLWPNCARAAIFLFLHHLAQPTPITAFTPYLSVAPHLPSHLTLNL